MKVQLLAGFDLELAGTKAQVTVVVVGEAVLKYPVLQTQVPGLDRDPI